MACPLATLSSKFQLEGLFLHGWGGSDAQSPYSGCYPLHHTTNSLLKSFHGYNHTVLHNYYLLFIFGCAGSSLLCSGFSSLRQARATLQLWYAGFSLRWLLLSQSPSSRVCQLQWLRLPGSNMCVCVSCSVMSDSATP